MRRTGRRPGPAESAPRQSSRRRAASRVLLDGARLPNEVVAQVLSWVPPQTLATRCRLVCRRWRDLLNGPAVWKLQWERDPSMRAVLQAASRCPRLEWSRVSVLRPLGRNLVRNPCGREQFQHWTLQGGGDGWRVEVNRTHVEGAEAQSCFASSCGWGGCVYKLSVALLAANKKTEIALFEHEPDPVPQWNDASYQQMQFVASFKPPLFGYRFSLQLG